MTPEQERERLQLEIEIEEEERATAAQQQGYPDPTDPIAEGATSGIWNTLMSPFSAAGAVPGLIKGAYDSFNDPRLKGFGMMAPAVSAGETLATKYPQETMAGIGAAGVGMVTGNPWAAAAAYPTFREGIRAGQDLFSEDPLPPREHLRAMSEDITGSFLPTGLGKLGGAVAGKASNKARTFYNERINPEQLRRWTRAQEPSAASMALNPVRGGPAQTSQLISQLDEYSPDLVEMNITEGIDPKLVGSKPLEQAYNKLLSVKESSLNSKAAILRKVDEVAEANGIPKIDLADLDLSELKRLQEETKVTPLAAPEAEAGAMGEQAAVGAFRRDSGLVDPSGSPLLIEQPQNAQTLLHQIQTLDTRLREIGYYDAKVQAGAQFNPAEYQKAMTEQRGISALRAALADKLNTYVNDVSKTANLPYKPDIIKRLNRKIRTALEFEPHFENRINDIVGNETRELASGRTLTADQFNSPPNTAFGAIQSVLDHGAENRKAMRNFATPGESVRRLQEMRDLKGAPRPQTAMSGLPAFGSGLGQAMTPATITQGEERGLIAQVIMAEYPSYNPSNGRLTSTEDKQRLAYSIETNPDIPREKKSRMYADAIVGIFPAELKKQASEQASNQLSMPDASLAYGAVENGVNAYGQQGGQLEQQVSSTLSTASDWLLKKIDMIKGVDYERSGL